MSEREENYTEEYEENENYSVQDEVEEKKKLNKGMIALIAISIIAVVGVILYFVLDGAGIIGKKDVDKVVALGNYQEFTYDELKTDVTDADVVDYYKGMIETYIQQGYKVYERDEEKDENEVADGDTVNIDFKGFVDGEAFAGGESAGYDLTIGSKSFIDTFEEQLIGWKIGDTKDIKVKFPDNYGKSDLAGKDAVFTVTLNYFCKETKLTEENAYEKVFGFKTLEELYSDLKDYLVESNKQEEIEYGEYLKTEYLNSIIDGTSYDPLTKETDDFFKHYYGAMEKLAGDTGITMDQMATQYGYKTLDEFKAELKVQSEEEIKKNITLELIAKKENIKLTDEKYKEMAEAIVKEQQYSSVDEYVAKYDGYYGEGMFKLYITNEYILDELYTKYAKSTGNKVSIEDAYKK